MKSSLMPVACLPDHLNKLIFIFIFRLNHEPQNDFLYLQKEMISASRLKHPLYFKKFVKLLIDFTKLLCETNAINPNNPLIVNIFKVDSSSLSEYGENCNFVDIKIETEMIQHNFQINNIKLLAHSYLLCNPVDHRKLMQNCTECFLNVLNHPNLLLKTNCFSILCKIWKELLINSQQTILEITKNIFHVLKETVQLIATLKKLNINGRDHLEFIETAVKFCEVFKFHLSKFNRNLSANLWTQSVDILLLLQQINDREMHQMKITFYKLLEKILNLWTTDVDENILKIEPILRRNMIDMKYDSKSIPILAYYFLYNLTTTTNETDNQRQQSDSLSCILKNTSEKIQTLESEAEIAGKCFFDIFV